MFFKSINTFFLHSVFYFFLHRVNVEEYILVTSLSLALSLSVLACKYKIFWPISFMLMSLVFLCGGVEIQYEGKILHACFKYF